MIKKTIYIFKKIKNIGPLNTYKRFVEYLYLKILIWRKIKKNFVRKKGIEIGGPSALFKKSGLVPIYSIANQVDVCNYGTQTIWEGSIYEGYNFKPEGKIIGRQYICDGADLFEIENESYDFIASCHNLEHFSNPLGAVSEWLRILKTGGSLLLVLPDRQQTFDRLRPITEFSHLLSDFENKIGEDDQSHLDEVIDKTDLTLYPKEIAFDKDEFIKISKNNINNRCMHHHVFDFQLLEDIFAHFKIIKVVKAKASPFHLIIVGKK